ncbi:type II secretion system F family protein [Pontiella sp.]|uniref:type II secretion system F family protein n=1 Tax=Pontiella sp. TaxID=2837462 RepID=UPI00356897DC
MDNYILISSSVFLFSAFVIAWQLMRTAQHVTYITLADGRRQERSLPFLIRLSLPLAAGVPKYITEHRSFEQSRMRLDQKLVSSGYEGLIQPREMIGLRIVVPLGIGGFLCLLLAALFFNMEGKFGQALAERQAAFYVLFLILFGFYPDLWLKRAVKERHHKIERALPFVLDLLTLSVESGLDFMTGINRIIQSRDVDPLAEELIRMFREIQVGRSRKEALKNLSNRIGHADVRSLTNALIQADELGSGIGGALRIQADQIRTKRFQRAEKLGNEAPVKMIFPLVFFIFPSVFLILLGPVMLQMMTRGGL